MNEEYGLLAISSKTGELHNKQIFTILKRNQDRILKDKLYYDEKLDMENKEKYYDGLPISTPMDDDLYSKISDLLSNTHTNQLSYRQSRMELHSWVDLREDGQSQSIYSGNRMDPEQILKQELQILERTISQLDISSTDPQFNEKLNQLEEKLIYNVEHVIPQSWFGKRSPMVGDLHHLYACEKDCNSFRSNIPYYDFINYPVHINSEIIKNSCGKREGTVRFEPEGGKGEVSRSALYFLLRYPGKIINSNKDNLDIALCKKWHKEHPVSLHEKHRNAAIFEIQGNRNPLIDFPESVDNIDFSLGL